MNWPYWTPFLAGLALTLKVTVGAYLGAVLIGVIGVSMRISSLAPLRFVSAAYVELVRNTPALALLFIVVFGLPQVDIRISLLWSAIFVLAIYEGAFATEALRAGINTVDLGSTEAARALGLNNSGTLWFIVLPQAVRTVVQPLTNVFIKTAINSSLVAIVGLADLTGVAERINIREAEPLLFFGAGLTYVVISLLGGALGGFVDRKVRFNR